MTGEVCAVSVEGTVAVLYVMAANGAEIAVAAEPRMAHDLEEALRYDERPVVIFEPWQVLWPKVPVR